MANKITRDGFIWLLVDHEQAKLIFNSGLFELYMLYDNDAEGLIESMDSLNEALEKGMDIGIEVGFLEVKQTAKWCGLTSFTDPETKEPIDMAVYKHENGGMLCIDASFIEQVAVEDEEDDVVCYVGDPFTIGGILKLTEY